MKEQIYTIPVIDGFKEKGECPFCSMYKKLDSDAIDYMLGPSYMEDDIRMDTDKLGFCKTHYKKMYLGQNRLGIALMMHTHLQKINKDIQGLASENISSEKKILFTKPKTDNLKINTYLTNIANSCYICNKIDVTFSRYMDTFFYIWAKDDEIKESVKESSGFCLEHFDLLIKTSREKLNQKALDEFLKVIIPLQLENLKRLEDEVDWFINKFDYKYNDEPWKTSKDALIRAIAKVSSVFVED